MALVTIPAAQLRVGDVVQHITGPFKVTGLTYGPAWVTVDSTEVAATYSCCTKVRVER